MLIRICAAFFLLGSLLSSAGTSFSEEVKLALLAPETVQQLEPEPTCGEGEIVGNSCRPQILMAAGAECPATSGEYCSDDLPYCCGTPGNYYCAKNVNGC